jgi:hypothetical protein
MSLSALAPKIPESLQVPNNQSKTNEMGRDGQKMSKLLLPLLAPKIPESLRVSTNKSQTKTWTLDGP